MSSGIETRDSSSSICKSSCQSEAYLTGRSFLSVIFVGMVLNGCGLIYPHMIHA